MPVGLVQNISVPSPLVSVIVAAHDGQAYIGQTLRAALGQANCSIEVIVVDDGSTDQTLNVVRNVGGQVRIIEQRNSGVSAARNAGTAAATGEFICFLDQDDIWFPDHLRRHVDVLLAHPEVGVVVSPYQNWYATEGVYPTPESVLPPPPTEELDPDFSGWVFHQFMLDCWALTSATTIRRKALLESGGFDEQRPYGEDWDLWLRLAYRVPFAKLRWPPVLYRQHNAQGSRSSRPIDYRTRLLLDNYRRLGLCSRDGRCVSVALFRRTLARYQMEFGRHQLQYGKRRYAIPALWGAWLRDPFRWRYLAWAFLALSGLRPQR